MVRTERDGPLTFEPRKDAGAVAPSINEQGGAEPVRRGRRPRIKLPGDGLDRKSTVARAPDAKGGGRNLAIQTPDAQSLRSSAAALTQDAAGGPSPQAPSPDVVAAHQEAYTRAAELRARHPEDPAAGEAFRATQEALFADVAALYAAREALPEGRPERAVLNARMQAIAEHAEIESALAEFRVAKESSGHIAAFDARDPNRAEFLRKTSQKLELEPALSERDLAYYAVTGEETPALALAFAKFATNGDYPPRGVVRSARRLRVAFLESELARAPVADTQAIRDEIKAAERTAGRTGVEAGQRMNAYGQARLRQAEAIALGRYAGVPAEDWDSKDREAVRRGREVALEYSDRNIADFGPTVTGELAGDHPSRSILGDAFALRAGVKVAQARDREVTALAGYQARLDVFLAASTASLEKDPNRRVDPATVPRPPVLANASGLGSPADNPAGAEADLERAAAADPSRRDPTTVAGARHHEDLRQVRGARLAVLAPGLEAYAPAGGLVIPTSRGGEVVYVPPPPELAGEVVGLRHTLKDMDAATVRRLLAKQEAGETLNPGEAAQWNEVLADHAQQARALDGYNLVAREAQAALENAPAPGLGEVTRQASIDARVKGLIQEKTKAIIENAGGILVPRSEHEMVEIGRRAADPATDSAKQALERRKIAEEQQDLTATLSGMNVEMKRAQAAYDVAVATIDTRRNLDFSPGGAGFTDAMIYGSGGRTAGTGGFDALMGVPGAGRHLDESVALYAASLAGIEADGSGEQRMSFRYGYADAQGQLAVHLRRARLLHQINEAGASGRAAVHGEEGDEHRVAGTRVNDESREARMSAQDLADTPLAEAQRQKADKLEAIEANIERLATQSQAARQGEQRAADSERIKIDALRAREAQAAQSAGEQLEAAEAERAMFLAEAELPQPARDALAQLSVSAHADVATAFAASDPVAAGRFIDRGRDVLDLDLPIVEGQGAVPRDHLRARGLADLTSSAAQAIGVAEAEVHARPAGTALAFNVAIADLIPMAERQAMVLELTLEHLEEAKALSAKENDLLKRVPAVLDRVQGARTAVSASEVLAALEARVANDLKQINADSLALTNNLNSQTDGVIGVIGNAVMFVVSVIPEGRFVNVRGEIKDHTRETIEAARLGADVSAGRYGKAVGILREAAAPTDAGNLDTRTRDAYAWAGLLRDKGLYTLNNSETYQAWRESFAGEYIKRIGAGNIAPSDPGYEHFRAKALAAADAVAILARNEPNLRGWATAGRTNATAKLTETYKKDWNETNLTVSTLNADRHEVFVTYDNQQYLHDKYVNTTENRLLLAGVEVGVDMITGRAGLSLLTWSTRGVRVVQRAGTAYSAFRAAATTTRAGTLALAVGESTALLGVGLAGDWAGATLFGEGSAGHAVMGSVFGGLSLTGAADMAGLKQVGKHYRQLWHSGQKITAVGAMAKSAASQYLMGVSFAGLPILAESGGLSREHAALLGHAFSVIVPSALAVRHGARARAEAKDYAAAVAVHPGMNAAEHALAGRIVERHALDAALHSREPATNAEVFARSERLRADLEAGGLPPHMARDVAGTDAVLQHERMTQPPSRAADGTGETWAADLTAYYGRVRDALVAHGVDAAVAAGMVGLRRAALLRMHGLGADGRPEPLPEPGNSVADSRAAVRERVARAMDDAPQVNEGATPLSPEASRPVAAGRFEPTVAAEVTDLAGVRGPARLHIVKVDAVAGTVIASRADGNVLQAHTLAIPDLMAGNADRLIGVELHFARGAADPHGAGQARFRITGFDGKAFIAECVGADGGSVVGGTPERLTVQDLWSAAAAEVTHRFEPPHRQFDAAVLAGRPPPDRAPNHVVRLGDTVAPVVDFSPGGAGQVQVRLQDGSVHEAPVSSLLAVVADPTPSLWVRGDGAGGDVRKSHAYRLGAIDGLPGAGLLWDVDARAFRVASDGLYHPEIHGQSAVAVPKWADDAYQARRVDLRAAVGSDEHVGALSDAQLRLVDDFLAPGSKMSLDHFARSGVDPDRLDGPVRVAVLDRYVKRSATSASEQRIFMVAFGARGRLADVVAFERATWHVAADGTRRKMSPNEILRLGTADGLLQYYRDSCNITAIQYQRAMANPAQAVLMIVRGKDAIIAEQRQALVDHHSRIEERQSEAARPVGPATTLDVYHFAPAPPGHQVKQAGLYMSEIASLMNFELGPHLHGGASFEVRGFGSKDYSPANLENTLWHQFDAYGNPRFPEGVMVGIHWEGGGGHVLVAVKAEMDHVYGVRKYHLRDPVTGEGRIITAPELMNKHGHHLSAMVVRKGVAIVPYATPPAFAVDFAHGFPAHSPAAAAHDHIVQNAPHLIPALRRVLAQADPHHRAAVTMALARAAALGADPAHAQSLARAILHEPYDAARVTSAVSALSLPATPVAAGAAEIPAPPPPLDPATARARLDALAGKPRRTRAELAQAKEHLSALLAAPDGSTPAAVRTLERQYASLLREMPWQSVCAERGERLVVFVGAAGNLRAVAITRNNAHGLLAEIKTADVRGELGTYELRQALFHRAHLASPDDSPHVEPVSSFEVFTIPKDLPKNDAIWNVLADPAAWLPERRALHERLEATARTQADNFAREVQVAKPTIFALRGNTAVGKSRSYASIAELAAMASALDKERYRANNPDVFKADLMEHEGRAVTSSSLHLEGSISAHRLYTERIASRDSMLIDKRLLKASDVEALIVAGDATGRQVRMIDIAAPLETSLVGVLMRNPKEGEAVPPLADVVGGFVSAAARRGEVVKLFLQGKTHRYDVMVTNPDGSKTAVVTVENGEVTVRDQSRGWGLLNDPSHTVEAILGRRIDDALIGKLTEGMTEPYATKVRDRLSVHKGRTLEGAYTAHFRGLK